jgi:hypothetical protein
MVTLWGGLLLSVAIRFLLSAMGSASLLGRRLEVVSPVTSLTRCMFFPSPFSFVLCFALIHFLCFFLDIGCHCVPSVFLSLSHAEQNVGYRQN